MTRIYENRGFKLRMNVSCIVVACSVLLGIWEFYSAYLSGGESQSNYLFGFLFIGGAIYAAGQLRDGYSNSVVTLDADMATGEAKIEIWRPFSGKTISGPLDRLTDWQFHSRRGRVRTPTFTAHHADYPRLLEFEIHPKTPIGEELRQIAAEAVAAFEARRSGG